MCQALQAVSPPAPLYPCRFCGLISRDNVFIMVDAHSKWLEIITTMSQQTINALSSVFSCYSLLDELVFDNRPQFTSGEFAQFLKWNGIKHTLPQINWQNGSFRHLSEACERNNPLASVCQSFCSPIRPLLMPPWIHHPENCFCNETVNEIQHSQAWL